MVAWERILISENRYFPYSIEITVQFSVSRIVLSKFRRIERVQLVLLYGENYH
jgi:hypothetical protein